MPEDLTSLLRNKFHIVGIEEQSQCIVIESGQIKNVCLFLKQSLGFDYLSNLAAIDYKDRLGLVYIFYSFKTKKNAYLKVFLQRNDPAIQSITDIFSAANWHEREAFDLMGIKFIGHPDLRRILLPDDWQGHPLRKDYEKNDMIRMPQ